MSHTKKLIPAYIIVGYLCLIAASYLDNTRGPLLPIISQKLSFTYEQTSWFITTGNIAAGIATIGLMFFLYYFSERRTVMIIGALVFFALMSSLVVNDFISFLILGASIGGSISLLGTMSNILTIKGSPTDKQPNLLAGLHTMYGLGSMLGPILMTYLLSENIPWNLIFLVVIPIIIFNFGFIKISAKELGPTPQQKIETKSINLIHIVVLLFMTIYINGELLASMWLATYLNQAKQIAVEHAAYYVSGFFFCLTISRFATFLLTKPHREPYLLAFALIIPTSAFALGFFFDLYYLLPLIGFVGPFFPIMLSKISKAFPTQWQFMTVGIMITQQLMGGICHWLIGRITDTYGITAGYFIPGAFLLITLVALPFIYSKLQLTIETRTSPIGSLQ